MWPERQTRCTIEPSAEGTRMYFHTCSSRAVTTLVFFACSKVCFSLETFQSCLLWIAQLILHTLIPQTTASIAYLTLMMLHSSRSCIDHFCGVYLIHCCIATLALLLSCVATTLHFHSWFASLAFRPCFSCIPSLACSDLFSCFWVFAPLWSAGVGLCIYIEISQDLPNPSVFVMF